MSFFKSIGLSLRRFLPHPAATEDQGQGSDVDVVDVDAASDMGAVETVRDDQQVSDGRDVMMDEFATFPTPDGNVIDAVNDDAEVKVEPNADEICALREGLENTRQVITTDGNVEAVQIEKGEAIDEQQDGEESVGNNSGDATTENTISEADSQTHDRELMDELKTDESSQMSSRSNCSSDVENVGPPEKRRKADEDEADEDCVIVGVIQSPQRDIPDVLDVIRKNEKKAARRIKKQKKKELKKLKEGGASGVCPNSIFQIKEDNVSDSNVPKTSTSRD